MAGHNDTPIAITLERLRRGRLACVRKLESLREEEIARTALHPRLRQQMRLLDRAWFIAEHDDHHRAKARRAIQDNGNLVRKKGVGRKEYKSHSLLGSF